MADFFTMEATDYLERLDTLVSPPESPESGDFLRLTRALRGSAVMANQHQIGDVAGGLEAMARAMVEQRTTWDESTRLLAIRAVDDLKVLVRAIQNWSDAEDARATQIAAELERYSGRSTLGRRLEQTGLDTGTRAFIAREGASVAAGLTQAAQTLRTGTALEPAFEAVTRSMQPLRGIASLSELPPFPDLLEGATRAMGEIHRRTPSPNDAAILETAARAVSDIAQQIATGGVDLSSHDANRFAEMLGEVTDLEVDVVPIETLYHDDDGPHVVQPGTATAAPGHIDRVELVSHLEYLIQAAHELDRAGSTAQRSLRIYALGPTLRALSVASGGPLVSAAAAFAHGAKVAIHDGTATTDPDTFAARLRSGGQTLNEAAQTPQLPPLGPLNALADSFRGPPVAPAAPSPAPPPPAAAAPPAPTAPATPTAPPAPAAAAEPDPLAETDLAAAFTVCGMLIEEHGNGNGTLEELIAGPPALPRRTVAGGPVPAPVPDQPLSPASPDDVVMITDLQYEPAAALNRALELRVEVRSAVAAGDTARADQLLDEIFDLVKIGSGTSP